VGAGKSNTIGSAKLLQLNPAGDARHKLNYGNVPTVPHGKPCSQINTAVITNHNTRTDSKLGAPLTVFHQNIRGLRGNLNELISHLYPTLPNVLCLSEHHMKQQEIKSLLFENYKLGDSYCRTNHEMGGVCIYVQKGIEYEKLNIGNLCQDKNIEACAIKIKCNKKNICIIAIYRAPSGNFESFFTNMDSILRIVYNPTLHIVMCGDINIDYLSHNAKKDRLNEILITYNLKSVVNFPTRIYKNSVTTIDNIFIDTTKLSSYSISPVLNGLSDHDAQLLTIHSLNLDLPTKQYAWIRKMDDGRIQEFLTKLSLENWEPVFSTNDVNKQFNAFLNVYIQIFYHSFPVERVCMNRKHNGWITSGIKISCKHKRQLFLVNRKDKDPALLRHYKKYCKILSSVITEAKRRYYADQITKASNKNKKIWALINLESNRVKSANQIDTLNINGVRIKERQKIANELNNYFLTIAKNIKKHNEFDHQDKASKDAHLSYLKEIFRNPIPNMKLNCVSTNVIKNIINSLKPKDSQGYDGITTKLLKISSPFIISPLTHICKFYTHRHFPRPPEICCGNTLAKKRGQNKCIQLQTYFSPEFLF
jgi:exonuclease III